jgi:hypothetical protein
MRVDHSPDSGHEWRVAESSSISPQNNLHNHKIGDGAYEHRVLVFNTHFLPCPIVAILGIFGGFPFCSGSRLGRWFFILQLDTAAKRIQKSTERQGDTMNEQEICSSSSRRSLLLLRFLINMGYIYRRVTSVSLLYDRWRGSCIFHSLRCNSVATARTFQSRVTSRLSLFLMPRLKPITECAKLCLMFASPELQAVGNHDVRCLTLMSSHARRMQYKSLT